MGGHSGIAVLRFGQARFRYFERGKSFHPHGRPDWQQRFDRGVHRLRQRPEEDRGPRDGAFNSGRGKVKRPDGRIA